MRTLIPIAGLLITGIALLSFPAEVTADEYGGIEFPAGAASFADQIELYAPGPEVLEDYGDPNNALGVPDFAQDPPQNTTSLGWGGTLVLRFTDNSLTTSGDSSADLHLFETGDAVEPMEVSISKDGSSWIDLGTVSGQPTSVDIDSVPGVILGETYAFVRIVDSNLRVTGSPYGGADIDAVGAISSGAASIPPVPLMSRPAWALLSSLLLFQGILFMRRLG